MRKLIYAILIASRAFAIPSGGQIEVRTTGANGNSGMFAATTTSCTSQGTDYTQQDATHVTFDGSTITATTSGTSTTITITGYTVATTDRCNSLRITAGTNFTASLYIITSVNVGANTWTLNANVSSGAGSAMVGTMGGGIATLAQAFSDCNVLCVIWVKSGTYTSATTITESAAPGIEVRGYQTTHGDHTGTRPLLTSSTNSIALITMLASFNNTTIWFDNINFSHTAGTRGNCFQDPGNAPARPHILTNIQMDGCLNGVLGTTNGWISLMLTNVEIKNSITDGINTISNTYIGPGSWLHANGRDGLRLSSTNGGATTISCDHAALAANTGRGGFITISAQAGASWTSNGCDYYGNGLAGLELNGTAQAVSSTLTNNIFEGNGTSGAGFGISYGDTSGAHYRNTNAFFNNHDGAVSGPTVAGGGTALPVAVNDITNTATAFTAAGSGDFSLNATPGGGAALKGAGYQGSLISGAAIGLDVGSVQTSGGASSGGGNSAYVQ